MTRDELGGVMVALEGIREDNQYMRGRLDNHINRENDFQSNIQKQLSDLSSVVSTQHAVIDHKVKGIVAGISAAVSLIVAIAGWAAQTIGS